MKSHSFLNNNPKIQIMNQEFEAGRHLNLSKSSFHEVGYLGKGAFGIVKKVKSKKTGKIYALKLLQRKSLEEEDMIDQFMKEGWCFLKKLFFDSRDRPYIFFFQVHSLEIYNFMLKIFNKKWKFSWPVNIPISWVYTRFSKIQVKST